MTCIFCYPEKAKADIIAETPNFWVMVGIGLIAEGQVMLVTKKHFDCFGDLPDKLENEFQEIKNKIIKIQTEFFSAPFLLEYGIWGQTVNHAHIHFIPKKTKEYHIKSIIEEMVKPGNIDFEQVGRKKLKELYKKEGNYASFEENGKLFFCHTHKMVRIEGSTNPHISYRSFFNITLGLNTPRRWKDMTEDDIKLDEKKREITKKKLRGLL